MPKRLNDYRDTLEVVDPSVPAGFFDSNETVPKVPERIESEVMPDEIHAA